MNLFPSAFHSPVIEALGWTLLHSLWQGALIAAVLAIIVSALSAKASRMRYLMGMGAMSLLLLGSIITFGQVYQQPAVSEDPQEMSAIVPALPSEMEEAEAALLPTSTDWVTQVRDWLQPYAPDMALLWLIGLGIFLLRWISGFSYVQSLRYRDAQQMPYEWQVRINQLASRMGMTRTVLLIESARIDGPLTLGHVKPVVLVPLGLLSGLTPEQVEAILSHELAHIRRHDYLVNLLMSLVEVLFFYHPAVWWMGRELRKAREHCCDDLAVATCGNAMQYARTLAHLAEQTRPSLRLAPGLLNERKPLLYRIKRLLAPQALPQSRSKAVLASFLLMGCLLAAWCYPLSKSVAAEPTWEHGLTGPLGVGIPWFYEQEGGMEEAMVPADTRWEEASPEETDKGIMIWPFPSGELSRINLGVTCCDTPPPPPPPPVPDMPRMPQIPTPPQPIIPTLPAQPTPPSPPTLSPDADGEAYEEAWEAYGDQMETWAESWGEQYGEVMESYGEQMEAWGEQWGEAYSEAWDNYAEEMEVWAEEYATEEGTFSSEHEAELARMAARVQRLQEESIAENMEQHMRIIEQEVARMEREMSRVEREIKQQEREAMQNVREQAQKDRLQSIQDRRQSERDRIQSDRDRLQSMRDAQQSELDRLQSERDRAQAERDLIEEAERVRREAMEHAETLKEEAKRLKEDAKKANIKEKKLRAELVKDGLMNSTDDRLSIKASGGKLRINGKTLKGDMYQKYQQLLKEMGIDITKGNTAITITSKSSQR